MGSTGFWLQELMKTPFIYFPLFFFFFDWNRSLFCGVAAAVIRRCLYEKNIRIHEKESFSISHSGTCLHRSFNRYLPLHSNQEINNKNNTHTAQMWRWGGGYHLEIFFIFSIFFFLPNWQCHRLAAIPRTKEEQENVIQVSCQTLEEIDNVVRKWVPIFRDLNIRAHPLAEKHTHTHKKKNYFLFFAGWKKKKLAGSGLLFLVPKKWFFFFFSWAVKGNELLRLLLNAATTPKKQKKKKKCFTFRVFLRAHFCWLVEKDISLSPFFFCLFFFSVFCLVFPMICSSSYMSSTCVCLDYTQESIAPAASLFVWPRG